MTAFEIAILACLSAAVLLIGLGNYSLVDPWETHYAEVARRMLQDGNWIHTQWQDEGFRSKPVLTFWLIASSLRLFGFAEGGGFSGEMVSSPGIVFAVRFPFALFGMLGVCTTFWVLARLASRTVAWCSSLVLLSCPLYYFVGRQAITDMPMVASLIAAMSLFSMAISHQKDERTATLYVGPWNIQPKSLVMTIYLLLVVPQAICFPLTLLQKGSIYGPHPIVLGVCVATGLATIVLWLKKSAVYTKRSYYMDLFYIAIAVSILAKGLPAAGIMGVVCFLYVLLTGNWRALLTFRIPQGVLAIAVISVPWHWAMFQADGPKFFEYINDHLLSRAIRGVHGDRGTFLYYAKQLFVGTWPWSGLMIASCFTFFLTLAKRGRDFHLRFIVGLWAIVSVCFFCLVETKFHHYIFPAVPSFAIILGFWLSDVWSHAKTPQEATNSLSSPYRSKGLLCISIVGALVCLLVCRDLIGEEQLFIEMFVYRYDRPWPSGTPWNIDLGPALFIMGGVFSCLCIGLSYYKMRRIAITGLLLTALLTAWFGAHVYMKHAGTHWGMRDAAAEYYKRRKIHGVSYLYYDYQSLIEDWGAEPNTVVQKSFAMWPPQTLKAGDAINIYLTIESANEKPRPATPKQHKPETPPQRVESKQAEEQTKNSKPELATVSPNTPKSRHIPYQNSATITIPATVTAIDSDSIRFRATTSQRDTWLSLAKTTTSSHKQPRHSIVSDKLIAWRLYWRGENFWSAGEIWGTTDDLQTVFETPVKKKRKFTDYLAKYAHNGEKFFVLTEASRVSTLRNLLPVASRPSLQTLDTTSNKFSLASFIYKTQPIATKTVSQPPAQRTPLPKSSVKSHLVPSTKKSVP